MSSEPMPHPFLHADFRPKLRANVARHAIGSESIVWAGDAPEPVYLDPVATLVASVFDGEGTLEELAADVADAFEIDPDVANGQVSDVLSSLAGGRCLEHPGVTDEPWMFTRSLLPEPNW